MSGKITQPLPTAPVEYNPDNEAITRRQVEQNFEETNTQVDESRAIRNGRASAAHCRFQFLLMGAASG